MGLGRYVFVSICVYGGPEKKRLKFALSPFREIISPFREIIISLPRNNKSHSRNNKSRARNIYVPCAKYAAETTTHVCRPQTSEVVNNQFQHRNNYYFEGGIEILFRGRNKGNNNTNKKVQYCIIIKVYYVSLFSALVGLYMKVLYETSETHSYEIYLLLHTSPRQHHEHVHVCFTTRSISLYYG